MRNWTYSAQAGSGAGADGAARRRRSACVASAGAADGGREQGPRHRRERARTWMLAERLHTARRSSSARRVRDYPARGRTRLTSPSCSRRSSQADDVLRAAGGQWRSPTIPALRTRDATYREPHRRRRRAGAAGGNVRRPASRARIEACVRRQAVERAVDATSSPASSSSSTPAAAGRHRHREHAPSTASWSGVVVAVLAAIVAAAVVLSRTLTSADRLGGRSTCSRRRPSCRPRPTSRPRARRSRRRR